MAQPFVPPPYPYDRLDAFKRRAAELPGGVVDLSIGTPCDPPPEVVVEALARSGAERGYPPSIGSAAYREAAAGWMARRLGVTIDPAQVAACVG
ncbi:MAG: aminotransferase class I/II-fold pyridoxal phosphate-dependent enzyme, partial [Acidimicrobiales bacterium]